MDSIECLGTQLEHAGHAYTLWLQRNEWFLYCGHGNGTSFLFFIIIKADRKPGPVENGDCYWLKRPREHVNMCGPFYGASWLASSRFLFLGKNIPKAGMRYFESA